MSSRIPSFDRHVAAVFAFAALACIASPAVAADHEAQLRLTGVAKFQLSERWDAAIEAQARYGDTFERVIQKRIGGTFDYNISPAVAVGGGYFYSLTDKNNADDKGEHRTWQQISWRPGDIGNASVSLRTRLEERMLESAQTSWRARQALKLTAPLREANKTYAYGGGELLVNLNDTTWNGGSGIDEYRMTAGVGASLSKKLKADLGYLAIFKPRDSADTRITHNIMLTFTVKP